MNIFLVICCLLLSNYENIQEKKKMKLLVEQALIYNTHSIALRYFQTHAFDTTNMLSRCEALCLSMVVEILFTTTAWAAVLPHFPTVQRW